MPPARSPAQAEAARRNGARSRGPTTPEGKARSSTNALKHGLAAPAHLVLDDEDPAELDALYRGLVNELLPDGELEAHLVRRLAATLWKQDRADRLEAAVLAGPSHDLAYAPDGSLAVHAAASLNLARFNALRSYQAQLGREASRLLRELRLLRRERAGRTNEPERGEEARNEPENPPAAANTNVSNEPGGTGSVAAPGSRPRAKGDESEALVGALPPAPVRLPADAIRTAATRGRTRAPAQATLAKRTRGEVAADRALADGHPGPQLARHANR